MNMENLTKKNKIIIGVCLILVIIIIGLIIYFNVHKNNDDNSNHSDVSVSEKLTKALKLEVKLDTDKQIEITNLSNIDESKKIKVWIFSSPVYLGEFAITNSDGKYYLENLEDILKEKKIEDGNHQILLLQDDNTLGYFDISINNGTVSEKIANYDNVFNENDINEKENLENKNNGDSLKNNESKEEDKTSKKEDNNTSNKDTTTTKEVEVTEPIKFITEEVKEANMLKGKKETVTEGANGEKKITYKVTYDKNGKEIKREKLGETVIKEAQNAKVKVGISDYNLNDNVTYDLSAGLYCSKEEAESQNYQACDDSSVGSNTNYYQSVKIGSKEYLVCLNSRDCDDYYDAHIKLDSYPTISKGNGMSTVSVGGTKYYLDMRSGSDGHALNENICNELGLVCNRW